jgi:hypothetical protein
VGGMNDKAGPPFGSLAVSLCVAGLSVSKGKICLIWDDSLRIDIMILGTLRNIISILYNWVLFLYLLQQI